MLQCCISSTRGKSQWQSRHTQRVVCLAKVLFSSSQIQIEPWSRVSHPLNVGLKSVSYQTDQNYQFTRLIKPTFPRIKVKYPLWNPEPEETEAWVKVRGAEEGPKLIVVWLIGLNRCIETFVDSQMFYVNVKKQCWHHSSFTVLSHGNQTHTLGAILIAFV